jgi:hypothetical protein
MAQSRSYEISTNCHGALPTVGGERSRGPRAIASPFTVFAVALEDEGSLCSGVERDAD